MWHVFPVDTTVKLRSRIQLFVAQAERDPAPIGFLDRIIFTKAFNEIINLNTTSRCVSTTLKKLPISQGTLASEQSWNYDTIADTLEEKWDAIAGHPVFPVAEIRRNYH